MIGGSGQPVNLILDLVAGARLFATSDDGFMPFRARPEALKRGLVARIPHPDILKDLP